MSLVQGKLGIMEAMFVKTKFKNNNSTDIVFSKCIDKCFIYLLSQEKSGGKTVIFIFTLKRVIKSQKEHPMCNKGGNLVSKVKDDVMPLSFIVHPRFTYLEPYI